MKYHALFVIFEKIAKFEIVVCCKFLTCDWSPECLARIIGGREGVVGVVSTS